MQGYKFRTIIIDEAQSERQMNYLVDTILRPTMADFTDSLMILQGSPPRVPHTYFEKQLNNKEIPHFFWNFYSNKFIKDPDKTKANLARNARILMRMVDFMLADLPDGESRRVAVSYLSLVAHKMIGAFDVDPPASV